jgi:membrane protease YdiL (CAAX protease family)
MRKGVAAHRARAVPAEATTIWPVFVAYAVAVALVFVMTTGLVVAVALPRTQGHLADLPEIAARFAFSSSGIMASALVSAIVFAAVALVSTRLQKRPPDVALRLGRTRATIAGHVSAVLGMMGLSFASGAALDLLRWQEHGTMAAIARALEHPTAARLALAIITIAVAPAVSEECFFRGMMQTRLSTRWGRWPSIVTTAAGFGLIHLDPAQGSVAFAAGLFLGWVVERFNGIRPTILAHGLNNAAFIVIASFGSPPDGSRGGGAHAVVVLVIGSVVCVGSIAMLRSRLVVTPVADAGSLRE